MYLFRISMVILVLVIGLKLYDILPIKATETKTLDKAESAFKETQEMDELENLLEGISPGEAQALMHLSERHRELKELENELRNRQNLIEATKEYMEAKVIQLQELQNNVEKLLAAYKKEEESRILSWVKIYESMRPQDAAQIFDELDINTLLPVIDKMKETKVSALLAKMRPERARQITSKLSNSQEVLGPKKYNLCLCE